MLGKYAGPSLGIGSDSLSTPPHTSFPCGKGHRWWNYNITQAGTAPTSSSNGPTTSLVCRKTTWCWLKRKQRGVFENFSWKDWERSLGFRDRGLLVGRLLTLLQYRTIFCFHTSSMMHVLNTTLCRCLILRKSSFRYRWIPRELHTVYTHVFAVNPLHIIHLLTSISG